MKTYWPKAPSAAALGAVDPAALTAMGYALISGRQTDALRALITGITIDTTLLPQIQVNDPFGPPSLVSTQAKTLLAALKPKITISLGGGLGDQVVAPYGDPGATAWPVISAVGQALAVGAAGVLLLLVLRRRK